MDIHALINVLINTKMLQAWWQVAMSVELKVIQLLYFKVIDTRARIVRKNCITIS